MIEIRSIVIGVNGKWKEALNKAIEIMKISDIQIGIDSILPNTRLPPTGFSIHPNSHEFAYILEGKVILGTDEGEIELKKGDFLYNPPGTPHYTLNKFESICKLLWVLSPPIELDSSEEVSK